MKIKISQKNVLLKIASIFLAFSLLISFNSTWLIAFADNTSINTIEDDASKEAKEDEKSWPRAGKWGLAIQRGLVPPWNCFHNEVQDEIRARHREFEGNELTVTKANGKTGRVDIWNYDIDFKTAYFWEVKPGSYISPFKMIKAKNQLNEYVMSISQNTDYPISEIKTGGSLGNSDFSFNKLALLINVPYRLDKDIELFHFPESTGNFIVYYAYMGNGIILYWFVERDDDDDEGHPKANMDSLKNIFNETFWILLLKYIQELNKGNNPSGPPPAPATEVADIDASKILTYETSNAIVDSYNIINESFLEPATYEQLEQSDQTEQTEEVYYIKEENLLRLQDKLNNLVIETAIVGVTTATAIAVLKSDTSIGEVEAAKEELLLMIKELIKKRATKTISVMVGGVATCCFVLTPTQAKAIDNFKEYFQPYESYDPYNSEWDFGVMTPEMLEQLKQRSGEMSEDIKNQSSNYEESQNQYQRDPLIINFSGTDEIEFTSLSDGINFDLDNNGFDEKTAWIKNKDGFLAIDINGNGEIDNGGELFGDCFIMPNGIMSSNGFEALRSLDTNKNGKIDDNDDLFGNVSVNQNETDEEYTLFDQLVVWYGDEGRKDYVSLKSLNVDYIDLNCFPDPYNSENGTDNERSARREETSYVYFKDETDRKHISEFWFDVNTTSTVHDGEETVGNVKTIEQAIDDDETGELLDLCLSFNYTDDIAQKHYYLKKILYFITDSSDIPINSRGGNIDARDLHVIEAFMGHDFNGVNGRNPNAPAAEMLKEIYRNIETSYYNALNLKMSFGGYMTITFENEDEEGNSFLDISLLNEVIEKKIENDDYNAEILIYDLGVYLKSYDKIHHTNEFNKYKDYYSAKSQEYADTIELIGNNNTFIGAESNDTYTGSAKIDFVFGEDGNNTLYGSSANDQIYSGYGNDVMNGNTGDDSYYFGSYHGNDVVNDTEGDNKIIFIDGLSVDDYTTSVSSNGEFILTNMYTGDTITLTDFITHPFNYDFFSYNGSQTVGGGDSREVVEGSDADDYLDASDGFNIFYAGEGNDTIAGGNNIDFMYGGNGDDTLLGRNGTNIIYGEGGTDTIYDGDHSSYLNGGDDDDEIYGGGGDDILDGGAGNDILQGDHGNDTFIYGIDYDIDTLKDAAGEPNTIIIHGYHKSDMNNFRDGSNLIIDFGKYTGDRLIIERFFDYAANSDITFIFDDGTSLSRFDIRAKSLPIYGNGSGYLSGTVDDDIIDAGAGDTLICGANGEDTYIFGKGYDHDSIHEWGSDHSFVDFKDINSDEITIEKQDSNLNIYVNETEDELTILNFVYGASTFTFRFTDGAEGYVDKNTYKFIFTKQPDPVDEENITDSDISEAEDVFDEETDAAA